jgi:pimeloyl-ACP methyl ester carboxylesterase
MSFAPPNGPQECSRTEEVVALAGKVIGRVRSADGTEIAFDRVGEGPPVVLVGGALNLRAFPPLAEMASLLASDFTVINYDRRGRGDSGDAQAYAVAREVEDLAALVAEAGGSAYAYGISSGAILALEAAAAGVPLTRLALFEPPVPVEGGVSSEEGDFNARLAELISTDRRGDAVEFFLTGIGLPPEAVSGTRQSPAWPAMEAMAYTLLYDSALSEDRTLVTERLVSVKSPTLVIDSAGSSDGLGGSAQAVADALPDGRRQTLKGEYHNVAAEDLASAISSFFLEGEL